MAVFKPRPRAAWVTSHVDSVNLRIEVEVAIRFFRARNLAADEFARLKALAAQGITRYWSRTIDYQGKDFGVRVAVTERERRALAMKVVINRDATFARSHNSGIVAARLKYNGNSYENKSRADRAFELMAAHEFGHSVLLAAGGWRHSWGHKGTAVSLLQRTRRRAPCYPQAGEIDLMCYYNGIAPDFAACCSRTRAAASDVRALIELGLESNQ